MTKKEIIINTKEAKEKFEENRKAIFPTNDYVFKRIFSRQENAESTKSLIESIVGEDISKIELDKNTFLQDEILTSKMGILDVRAVLNNNIEVDIEMQLVDKKYIEKRLLYYWGRMYTRTLVKGDNYGKLRRTIVIMIADFELDILKDIIEYHTQWKIIETRHRKKILTDDFEIDILELPKVRKYGYQEENNKDLQLWMKFFTNPKGLEEEEMEENAGVRKAKEELDDLSKSEKEAYLAEMRLRYLRDKNAEKDLALEEGYEKGYKEAEIEMAKKMLEQGMDIETISLITGLSKEEIKKLK